MHLFHIAYTRLINQRIATTKFSTATELVRWMGAMQAQDYSMVRWAIGSRLPESTDQQIAAAFDTGELIRTHLLRPTWHVVAAEDIYWLLDLTAPQIKALMKSRNKQLGLTEELFTKSNAVIEKALAGGKYLTRQELMTELRKANILTDSLRTAHLMLQAELDGIVINGACKGKQQTYALLDERVPNVKRLFREEALAKLARTYFQSHGPATLPDFVWWSGLSVTEAKHALEMIRSDFSSEKVESQTYWFSNSLLVSESDDASVYLLPAFDEFMISYRDRSASLALENQQQAISGNGIFNPIIIVNGKVAGTWKRTLKKDKVVVETCFFQAPDSRIVSFVEKACVPMSRFFNQRIEVVHRSQ